MKSHFATYLTLLLVASSQLLYGQELPKNMDHLGSENGLASQLCHHLLEDDLGNIWISSLQEVQKYDGYNLKVFNIEDHQEEDS